MTTLEKDQRPLTQNVFVYSIATGGLNNAMQKKRLNLLNA